MGFFKIGCFVTKSGIYQKSRLLIPQLGRECQCKHVRFMSTNDDQTLSTFNAKDVLLQNIKSATDSSTVLEIVGLHYSVMNKMHVIQSLKCLFELQKSGCSNTTRSEIIESSEFLKLCQSLKNNSRSIQLNDTIEALKIVSYFGVSATSAIVQVLLQLIRHNVNELSLSQIVFLDFILLKNYESCPLVDALKIALPVVFEAQLAIKLDQSNVVQLAEMLQYASRKSLSDVSVNLLVRNLEKCSDQMDTTTAKNIAWALTKLNRTLSSPLLHHALQVVAEDIDSLTFRVVFGLLENVINNHSKNHPHIYHADFMDSCAVFVVKHDCGLENGTKILRKLSKIGHINIPLLDYLGKKVVMAPDALVKCKPSVLLSFVNGLAHANYKPKNWSNGIEEAILKNESLIQIRMDLPWIKFALELCSLDCFYSPLLKQIFEEEFLRKFLSRERNFLDHIQLLLLYQAVKALFPAFEGPFPPKDIIEKAFSTNGDHIKHFPLQSVLEQGLGGAPYVLSKAYTRYGHFIDHVVVMRKGGYPVAINHKCIGSKVLIEDLNIPADSQVILILAFHSGCYAINSHRLRGQFSLLVRSLESLGFPVISVSLVEWEHMPENEKIAFIMQSITQKIDSQQCFSEKSVLH